MTTEEINDFFVFRDQKSGQNVIRVKVKHKTVDKTVLHYCNDNDSEVRIPALLYLGAHPDEQQIKTFFLNGYRKQIGTHAFIQSKGELCCALCYLNLKNVYSVSEVQPISSVYPCFRNTGGPLVMGLLYGRSLTFSSGHRTFGRQIAGVQTGSGAVFDIEEDFLHNYKRYDQTGLYGLKVFDQSQPQTPFPNWNQETVFAIYVCRGARLIVADDRCYWSDPKILKNTPQKARQMDRSLFQESSLVIYEGFTNLCLCFEDGSGSQSGLGSFTIDFRKASTLFRPQDRFIGSILGGGNRFVIFLGSNDSQYNSICWQLMIRTNHSSPKEVNAKVDAFLLAPDGGRLLDIQPWNEGFEQIYWRHRYQRLYRSVLSPEPSSGRLGFGIPREPIMKRILGFNDDMFVEIPDSLCAPPPNYFDISPEDSDIRRYLWPILEKSVKRDTWAQLNPLIMYPPPAPALYPPIYEKHSNKLRYVGYGTQLKFYCYVKVGGMEVPAVKIDNNIYAVMKRRTEDYVWETNPIRPSASDSKLLSPYDYRLGSDYLIYHKTNIKIGLLGHYYLDGPFAESPDGVAPSPTGAKNRGQEQVPESPTHVKPTTTKKPELPDQGKPNKPESPAHGKPMVSPNKPADSPKGHSPVKGKPPQPGAGKPVPPKGNATKSPQTDHKKPTPTPTPPQQQHKQDKKKGQPKNNEGNKK